MGKLWFGIGCVAALLTGCGDSSDSDDAGPGSDAGVDAGADAGADVTAGNGFGEACKKTADCAPKLFCDLELDQSFTASNLPPGVSEVSYAAFPGGVCTPIKAAMFDSTGAGGSCNPSLPQAQQGCGPDGACVAVGLTDGTLYACRPLCDAADSDACKRFGYTCSFSLGACVEGCQTDEECRLQPVDRDGDGAVDTLTYDEASSAICDPKTFRCTTSEDGPSALGEPCERLDDCAADAVCIVAQRVFGDATFPGGYCTKLGCDLDGRECQDGALCASVRPLTPGSGNTVPACLTGCTPGAEAKDDRTGKTGHGEGCRDGYSCHYNGSSAEGEGICIGGNYNDVSASNVGELCQTDADCYSPFGLGACITLSVNGLAVSGTCTIKDCAVPAFPDDVCGSGNQCIGLSGDITFCVHTCATADDCATGFACTDDDDLPGTPKLCYPVCVADEDCRKGEERCDVDPTSMIGQCVASRP